MKKLLFFSILMMAVLSVNYSLKEPRVNTLLLDNIEALAADEQDVPTNCWGSGSVDCPVTKDQDNVDSTICRAYSCGILRICDGCLLCK